MDDEKVSDIDLSESIAEFTERYSSFSDVINRMQRQYLALKDTYTRQSDELSDVNESLQNLVAENRAVTEFLNSILGSLTSGVIAVDRTGKVTHINPSAMKILGLPGEISSVRGSHYADIISAVENGEFSAVGTVGSGLCIDSKEKRIETYYGTVVTLQVSTSLLKNKQGEIVGAVELFSDISKVKRLEEKLSRMKVLASLGELAAAIAHEVRNPLLAINGFASLLVRDLCHDPSKKAMAEKIVSGVNNINETIQNLLDFAHNDEINKIPVTLNEYLDSILEEFFDSMGPEFSRSCIRRDFIIDDEAVIEIDPHLFRQAIFNLIRNGLEASAAKPEVTVSCRTLPLDKSQSEFGKRLELSGLDRLTEIKIRDNGPGIPDSQIEKIFTPFYSTKENGTGLGLAIAWKIIKAHGGDLCLADHGSDGTTFSIILPMKVI